VLMPKPAKPGGPVKSAGKEAGAAAPSNDKPGRASAS